MKADERQLALDTPLGPAVLRVVAEELRGLRFARPGEPLPAPGDPRWRAVLDAWFADGHRPEELRLAPAGTPFQQQVWAEAGRIGRGQVLSYAKLAAQLGRPSAVRAVAAALAANPLLLLIPCHRVIGSDGQLRGYAGGLERKRALLALEAAPARPGGLA